jgi:hypothetical protein
MELKYSGQLDADCPTISRNRLPLLIIATEAVRVFTKHPCHAIRLDDVHFRLNPRLLAAAGDSRIFASVRPEWPSLQLAPRPAQLSPSFCVLSC